MIVGLIVLLREPVPYGRHPVRCRVAVFFYCHYPISGCIMNLPRQPEGGASPDPVKCFS